MFYVLGDIHGNFNDIYNFIQYAKPSQDDVLILLGDAGINYYLNTRDKIFKQKLQDTDITFFVVRGNHEQRPSILAKEHPDDWAIEERFGNSIYVEKAYPNILYALDTPAKYSFNINQNSKQVNAWVIPGAYSVDKNYRLERGWTWFPQEQLSKEEMKQGVIDLKQQDDIDIILSHTCPLSLIPTEMFLSCVNQSTVDNSMEKYLEAILALLYASKKLPKLWAWGHYHALKIYPKIDELRPIMLFNNEVLCLDDYFVDFNIYDSIIDCNIQGE